MASQDLVPLFVFRPSGGKAFGATEIRAFHHVLFAAFRTALGGDGVRLAVGAPAAWAGGPVLGSRFPWLWLEIAARRRVGRLDACVEGGGWEADEQAAICTNRQRFSESFLSLFSLSLSFEEGNVADDPAFYQLALYLSTLVSTTSRIPRPFQLPPACLQC